VVHRRVACKQHNCVLCTGRVCQQAARLCSLHGQGMPASGTTVFSAQAGYASKQHDCVLCTGRVCQQAAQLCSPHGQGMPASRRVSTCANLHDNKHTHKRACIRTPQILKHTQLYACTHTHTHKRIHIQRAHAQRAPTALDGHKAQHKHVARAAGVALQDGIAQGALLVQLHLLRTQARGAARKRAAEG